MTDKLFRVEMLPAHEGDCLFISYGDTSSPRYIVIDGGRSSTWAFLKQKLVDALGHDGVCELLVITHIDRDHIEGAISLVEDLAFAGRFKDVWFNGYHHLLDKSFEAFGPVQGERLSAALRKPRWAWNAAFGGAPVCVASDKPLSIELADGMLVTLLSPNRAKLSALAPKWADEVEKAGLVLGKQSIEEPEGYEALGPIDVDMLAASPFHGDTSKPNGSSIAFLLEFEGKRALFAGDAHVDLLIESLGPLAKRENGKVRIDALKVSHHGSKSNVSTELLNLLDCKRFLISTDGSHFRHPDREAVARIVSTCGGDAELFFNYRSEQTTAWENPKTVDRFGYRPIYSSNGQLVVDL